MNISSFSNWLVGDFEPALVQTKDVGVGVLEIAKGHKADGHFHRQHTEFNVILSGKAMINEVVYNKGDIFIFLPNERSYVEYLEDTILLVIKAPSVRNDKFY
jgi:quercetin dioxygenase-like cupin family protein